MNVNQIMEQIPDHFRPDLAKGVSGIVLCKFTGEQASNWVITISNQKCEVTQGTHPNPDLTIKADAEDGVKVLTGKMDAMRAYMMGKIKVIGDLSLGMKLTNLFNR